jgi:NAD(P) transhydrogenase subunit alpha
MRIVSILEDQKIEKRIAVTPEIAKKYIDLGFEVSLSENYGVHLGINDNAFKDVGATILKDEKELISNSNLIIQLGLLSEDKLSLINEGQSIIGIFNPYNNKEKLEKLAKKKN